jgi:hypothetical protein
MSLKLFKSKKKFLYLKAGIYIFLIVFSIAGLVYLNFYLKVRNINIEFFDEKSENKDIKEYLNKELRSKANNFLGYLFLDKEELTARTHSEYFMVSGLEVSKNFRLDLSVAVRKNQEFFYTCIPEEEGFLVNCMLGNIDGVYYKEIDVADEKKINMEVNTKALYSSATSKKIDAPDSLSGARIYTKEDFLILREIINWMLKNGYNIKKVYVDELRIVDIYTDFYKLKVSLDKGYSDTVKDFELISRTGDLQKYINEDRSSLEYIDLSYKNKVFYRLKGASTSTETSTSTATSTTVD